MDLDMDLYPPAKVRGIFHYEINNSKQSHELSVFKQIAAMKQHPVLIYEWFSSADEKQCKLAGTYGAHLLNESGYSLMALAVLDKIGVTPENMANGCEPPIATGEVAIVMVQALTSIIKPGEDFSTISKIVARFVEKGTRKRIVDLFLASVYRMQDFELAAQIIRTYLTGAPFTADAADLIPLLNTPNEIRNEVLSWFIGQEIYFPRELANAQVRDLPLLPMDLTEVKETIKMRLPMSSSSAKPVIAEPTVSASFKFVIDAANVLHSGGTVLLNNIISQLSPFGKVAVVLHIRHLTGKSNLIGAANIKFQNADLIKTPYGVNDDYYSIWIAMAHGAYLVTNDEFRDHVHKISPLIARWKKNYVMKFNHLSGALLEPLPFSHFIHCHNGQFWLPTEDTDKWIKC